VLAEHKWPGSTYQSETPTAPLFLFQK